MLLFNQCCLGTRTMEGINNNPHGPKNCQNARLRPAWSEKGSGVPCASHCRGGLGSLLWFFCWYFLPKDGCFPCGVRFLSRKSHCQNGNRTSRCRGVGTHLLVCTLRHSLRQTPKASASNANPNRGNESKRGNKWGNNSPFPGRSQWRVGIHAEQPKSVLTLADHKMGAWVGFRRGLSGGLVERA